MSFTQDSETQEPIAAALEGQLVLTPEEASQHDREQVEQERQRAEAERQRADRLAERLRQLGINPDEI